jgi:hypothetical protein
VNAVIFLGIVLMWVVVLVPMWLKRHDETEETRTVDRFSSAMHSLSRRESADPEKSYVVMPRRNWFREVHVSGASGSDHPRPSRAATIRRSLARRTASRRPLSVAERRRRTMLGLLSAAFLTLMLAVFVGGTLLWTLQILVDLAFVGFVAHLRIQARNAAVRRRIARRRASAYSYREPVESQAPADELELVEARYAPVADPVFDQTAAIGVEVAFDDEEFAPVAVAAGRGAVFDQSADLGGRDVEIDLPLPEPVAADAEEGDIGARPWEPVPVPRPTYTSKPVAPPRRRRKPEFEPVLPPEPALERELDPVDDLEEILDRRWAVND